MIKNEYMKKQRILSNAEFDELDNIIDLDWIGRGPRGSQGIPGRATAIGLVPIVTTI